MKLTFDPMPAAQHRPDIEGLRAVAVIAVVLFHLGIGTFSGGYVGVDVFFVISGFLIGGIIVRERADGSFSFRGYLTRRIKRIVPVMLLVLFAVSVVAAMVLMPSELVDYSWSLGFSALFLGNFHFWLHRGAYADSEHEVLLHMWTLGVEGQFYLVLPLIVLGLMRFGRSAQWFGLVALAAVSAAISMLYPSASFYTLPARLWEFLLGMMVAITPLPFLKARWVREGLALLGLGLILYAATSFHADTPFPGWRAVIPCAGAAAIIAAGSNGSSWVEKALTFQPMRFVGKISYSLYLWHWPVIVLLLLGLPAAQLDPALQLLAVIISFLLATLSWRYVEEPFRKGALSNRRLIAGTAAATGALVVVSLVWTFSLGWPQRFSERGQEIAASFDYPLDQEVFRAGQCFIHHRSQSFDQRQCLRDDSEGTNVLLVGDSHAAHLWPGLSEVYSQLEVSQVTASGCRPVLNQPPDASPFCAELMARAFGEFLHRIQPTAVVLAGHWEEGDLPALDATLKHLFDQGYEVTLVGPAAEWSQYVPRLLILEEERGTQGIAENMRIEGQEELDNTMAAMAAETGAAYISLLELQCGPMHTVSVGCRYFSESGAPLVVDHSHLTRDASVMLMSMSRLMTDQDQAE